MNAFEVPSAVLAFLMIAAVVPAWMWFLSQYGTVAKMSLPSQFLLGLAMPATIGFLLVSWLQP